MIIRQFQFDFDVPFEHVELSDLFELLLLIFFDGALVEVVFDVEVGPDQVGGEYRCSGEVEEGFFGVSGADEGVESEEGADYETPFQGGEGEGVAEDVFAAEVVVFVLVTLLVVIHFEECCFLGFTVWTLFINYSRLNIELSYQLVLN